ncbi:hypothetical protein BRPE64_CCDS07840 [Caballeronia insecticola]|uniref:Uncharacterized protein n=1 Tax=Caballeronia insecticola TaxID=758793 RepID=R4X400_9BURK|nr:hypothetical protein BRPE64_CCDS07840 [Caballeronia insecticola]
MYGVIVRFNWPRKGEFVILSGEFGVVRNRDMFCPHPDAC